jgi:hypothetical protein
MKWLLIRLCFHGNKLERFHSCSLLLRFIIAQLLQGTLNISTNEMRLQLKLIKLFYFIVIHCTRANHGSVTLNVFNFNATDLFESHDTLFGVFFPVLSQFSHSCFRFPTFSSKRLYSSKCASGASKLVSY